MHPRLLEGVLVAAAFPTWLRVVWLTSGEVLGYSRHKSVRINTVYQTCSTETADHRNSYFLHSSKQQPIKNDDPSFLSLPRQNCNPSLQYHTAMLQYPFNLVQYNALVSIQNAYIGNNNGVNGIAVHRPVRHHKFDWYNYIHYWLFLLLSVFLK
jgi:hypothetical protein